MTRSLNFKLVLAFIIVSITAAAMAAILAQWGTSRVFEQLLRDQERNAFITAAASYYADQGAWEGAVEDLRRQTPAASPSTQSPPPAFALVDQNGQVRVPAGQYPFGQQVPPAELARGEPVKVKGETVGTVLGTGTRPLRDPLEERYMTHTHQALRYAALGAAVSALVLGALLARTLTSPLRELMAAVRAMAQGELAPPVPARSQDELGELAAAFNQMGTNLAHANAVRRQMTADIAHDLSAPLTVITGDLESLRDGVLKPSPARFDAIYSEVQRLQRLVEDLRTLSLADAGELPLNRRPTLPRALLEELAAAYEHRAARAGVTLQIRTNHYIPPIQVDPDRVKQVLSNLISNALRNTPAGGQISLTATQHEQQVLLSIQDDGAGTATEALPHAFERSHQGTPVRPEQSGASGLGLALARSIVKMHGGRMWAGKNHDASSAFIIALPSTSPRERHPPLEA